MDGKKRRDSRQNQLLVGDLAEFLVDLAKIYDQNKTGNTELSRALRYVALALRPHRHWRAVDLAEVIKPDGPSLPEMRPYPKHPKFTLPIDLERISQPDLEKILDDDAYTKEQIIEVGVQRYGISRSKLQRLRKDDARESVRAAMDHEKSLDVISDEALKGAKARSN